MLLGKYCGISNFFQFFGGNKNAVMLSGFAGNFKPLARGINSGQLLVSYAVHGLFTIVLSPFGIHLVDLYGFLHHRFFLDSN